MKNDTHSKGISPLLAAVLLIAVTVAIATLVMGWLTTITRTTQVTVSNRTAEATDCSSASVVIDEVYLDIGFNGTVRAIVRNAGLADNMQLTSAQVYNRTGSNFSGSSMPITNFNRGNVTTITFTANTATDTTIATVCSDFSRVLVTTNCGGVSAEFDRTPRCY